jgi:DNA-binding response OmpR family regulator
MHGSVSNGRSSVTVRKRRHRWLDAPVRISDKQGMTSPACILIVEDDDDIRQLVAALLVREGYAVETAIDGIAMDAVLARTRPDLVVLDLMLPREDGLSICRRLRASQALPILILSAKSDEIDRVIGLEMGADDYLVKPFGSRELLARVRALLRRGRPHGAQVAERRFAFDRFVIDLDARQLTADDEKAVTLTTAEFDLLACFVQHPRRVLSRDQILDWTHGRSAEPFDRTVDMLTSRLRRKLESSSAGSNLISTARNRGYLFTATVRPVTG